MPGIHEAKKGESTREVILRRKDRIHQFLERKRRKANFKDKRHSLKYKNKGNMYE